MKIKRINLKIALLGFLLAAIIMGVGAHLLENLIGNRLLASLTVGAVLLVYPLLSLFRALFSYEEGEESNEARLLREIKEAGREYIETKRSVRKQQ